jgi:hypothetical protein
VEFQPLNVEMER